MEDGKSIDYLVLGGRILLSRRLCRHRGEDVLLEEALLNNLLQVSSEGPTMDGLVPFTVMVGAVLL